MPLLGVKELKADFRGISTAMSNSLRVAAYAGAQIVRDTERQLAPRQTGHGMKSIVAARKRGTKILGVSEVGFLRPAFYLAILVTGAKRHDILAKLTTREIDPKTRKRVGTHQKKRAVLVAHGQFIARRLPGGKLGVSHPGVERTPFPQAAIAQSKVRVLTAMTERFNQALQKKGF